jgi:hypothetical protein
MTHAEFSRFVPGGAAAGVKSSSYLLVLHCSSIAHCICNILSIRRRITHPFNGHAAAETQFLDGFQGDVATVHMPGTTPSWLWNGMRCSRHPNIVLVRERAANLEDGTGTIHERKSAEEAEDGQDGPGLSGRGRAVLEARGGGDTGRREIGQSVPRGPWTPSLPADGLGVGNAKPPLPGQRDDEEEEEGDEEAEGEGEESLVRRGSLANPKASLGPVREAVQQLDAIEAVSQTISALALEGLELSNPSRKYL